MAKLTETEEQTDRFGVPRKKLNPKVEVSVHWNQWVLGLSIHWTVWTEDIGKDFHTIRTYVCFSVGPFSVLYLGKIREA